MTLLHFGQPVCGSGTDAKLLPRRLLDSTCTDWSPSFGQCGGMTCPGGSGSQCSDAVYKCCPPDYSCQRQNQWYWQCLPGSPSPGTTSAAPTKTPSVPGGATASCCKALHDLILSVGTSALRHDCFAMSSCLQCARQHCTCLTGQHRLGMQPILSYR